MAPRVWVFDVDDTLYLERDYVRSGFLAVGRHLEQSRGWSGAFDVLWEDFVRGVRGDAFQRLLAALGQPAEPELVADLVRTYREHAPEIRLLDDARALLDRVPEGHRIAVLTDGPAASQRAKVLALGLRALADPVVITAELGPAAHKPGTAGFELIQRATGAAPADLVYVGDNPRKDFLGPRRLGWRTLRVRRRGSLHEEVPSGADVDEEVEDLFEVTRRWFGPASAGGLPEAPGPARRRSPEPSRS